MSVTSKINASSSFGDDENLTAMLLAIRYVIESLPERHRLKAMDATMALMIGFEHMAQMEGSEDD